MDILSDASAFSTCAKHIFWAVQQKETKKNIMQYILVAFLFCDFNFQNLAT